MKYISQMAIIFAITFLGELLNSLLPLPIPGSIYGFLIMLLCLQFKIIKLDMVKDVARFLLDNMAIMFVPAAVGLIVIWEEIWQNFTEIILISIITTVIVMIATGKVSDFIIKRDGSYDERDN